MNRFSVWLKQCRHKLLMLCSASYRSHDAIVDQLRQARGEMSQFREDARREQRRADELLKEGQQLSDRLGHALTAQESATSQLIAERALRQAAEERADRYHEELAEALKSSANWTCRVMGKRSMFAGVDEPEPEPIADKKREPLPGKTMARAAAARIENETLAEFWEDLRKSADTQVGPEASSA